MLLRHSLTVIVIDTECVYFFSAKTLVLNKSFIQYRRRPTRQGRRRRLRRRRPALSSRRLHLPTLMLLINTLHSYVTRDFIQLVVQPDFCRQCFETVYPLPPTTVAGWRRGIVVSGVRRMNEVNARRARLVPGWVTDFGRVYHLGM